MRARLARPRQSLRGRLVAPVAVASAVALVGGVVVVAPDAPTVRGDVQTVAVTAPAFTAGASYSFNIAGLVSQGEWAGIQITEVTGLPEGLTYADGVISGTVETSGVYPVTVVGTVNGETVSVPVTLVVNNTDGSAPAGAEGGSTAAVQGSLGGEAQAGGQITTGSDGADAILGAVAGIVASLGGDSGSAGELVAGSTGGGETTPGGDAPAGPLGSLTTGQIDMGSLGGGDVTPENPDAPAGSQIPGSSTTVDGTTGGQVGGEAGIEIGGDATAGLDTQSAGPLGSLIDTPTTETGSTGGGETTGGGEITIPGSTTTAETGSLGGLAPGLAVTGAALLGLAGLSLMLGGGSSTPGSTALLPALPGSSGGASVAPTVAAGAPAPTTVQAPGPTVANGRG